MLTFLSSIVPSNDGGSTLLDEESPDTENSSETDASRVGALIPAPQAAVILLRSTAKHGDLKTTCSGDSSISPHLGQSSDAVCPKFLEELRHM